MRIPFLSCAVLLVLVLAGCGVSESGMVLESQETKHSEGLFQVVFMNVGRQRVALRLMVAHSLGEVKSIGEVALAPSGRASMFLSPAKVELGQLSLGGVARTGSNVRTEKLSAVDAHHGTGVPVVFAMACRFGDRRYQETPLLTSAFPSAVGRKAEGDWKLVCPRPVAFSASSVVIVTCEMQADDD